MEVSLMNVKRQYELYKEEYDRVILEVAESGSYIGGNKVREFETEFAKYMDTRFAVSCGSGTDALVLALRALKIGKGDEVIVPGFTFFASAESIANVGATPVFADVDKDTYCIDSCGIEKLITDKTKAIMPVHLYGNCADMDEIRRIAQKYNLRIISDCAQCAGTKYKGSRKNVVGDVGCFSFFPTKNLGGIGDGGMVVTDDEYLANAIKSYSVHGSGLDFEDKSPDKGKGDKYYNHHIGYNSRLDAIQAAFLKKRLNYLDGLINERREVADYYRGHLNNQKFGLPYVSESVFHSYYLFTLQNEDAKTIMKKLNESGIESRTYYPIPVHLQKAFSYLGYHKGSLPVTEWLSETTFSIPLYPGMTKEEMLYVVEILNEMTIAG